MEDIHSAGNRVAGCTASRVTSRIGDLRQVTIAQCDSTCDAANRRSKGNWEQRVAGLREQAIVCSVDVCFAQYHLSLLEWIPIRRARAIDAEAGRSLTMTGGTATAAPLPPRALSRPALSRTLSSVLPPAPMFASAGRQSDG
jgi:hypothetical protein